MTANMQKQLLNQIWFNMQTMSPEERKKFKKYIESLNNTKSPFIHFYAKDFLNKLIQSSECYYKISE